MNITIYSEPHLQKVELKRNLIKDLAELRVKRAGFTNPFYKEIEVYDAHIAMLDKLLEDLDK